MYAKTSPFSLALAMLVRDQVLSLLSELKFLQKEKRKRKRPKSRRGNCLVLPHASYGPDKYTKIQGPRFQRNYIIARDQKSDLHGMSFQSSPKMNRMLITSLTCIQ